MWLLISFCNTIKRSRYYSNYGLSPLALLNLVDHEVYFLRIPRKVNPQGFTGISQNEEFIYALTQGKSQSYLLRIRKKDLATDLIKLVRQIKDGHSLLYDENCLYAVSSGTNTIEMFDPKLFRYLGRYWQHPDATAADDIVHLNSIFKVGDHLWVSAFGPKARGKWSLAKNGSLVDTKDGHSLYKIHHPHSGVYYQGEVYYCESWTGSVYKDAKLIKRIDGSYVRGLDVNDKYIAIGLSNGRVKSRSRGVVNTHREISRYGLHCGVLVLDKSHGEERYFDFSKYSREIHEYAREIYALRFITDFDMNSTKNIVGHYKLEPNSVIEKNYLASLLLDQNRNLEAKLSELVKKNNHLVDRVDCLRRELEHSRSQCNLCMKNLDEIRNLRFVKLYRLLGRLLKTLAS